MIKHTVLWTLDARFDAKEKAQIASTFKSELEALDTLLAGIIKIYVEINPLSGSNVDMMLESEFDSEETLQAYQNHPTHKAVAGYLVGKVASRSCMDCSIE